VGKKTDMNQWQGESPRGNRGWTQEARGPKRIAEARGRTRKNIKTEGRNNAAQ